MSTIPEPATPAQYRVWHALDERDCRPRGRPDQYMALCPAHDDRTPSLSVGYKADAVGLTCHAGCATEAVLDALALEFKDLFDSDRPDFQKRGARDFAPSPKGDRNPSSGVHGPQFPTPSPEPQPQPPGHFPIDTGDRASAPKTESKAVLALLQRVRDAELGVDPPDWTVPLHLERIPANASAARAVAEKVGTLMAVRLTDGDLDAAPLSGSLIARAMGWPDPDGDGATRGRKYLRLLCRFRVLRCDEPMPLRGLPHGTKTYQPADYDLFALFTSRIDGGLTVVQSEDDAASAA